MLTPLANPSNECAGLHGGTEIMVAVGFRESGGALYLPKDADLRALTAQVKVHGGLQRR